MTLPNRFTASTALALILATAPAFADVTAQDVWMDWKKYMESFGYELQASEATSGDTLTISDLVLAIPLPEDEGNISMNMGEMTFTNAGGGTVTIGLQESLPINFSMAPKMGEAVKGTVLYTNNDLNITVSGDPNDMTYVYDAASLVMTLQDLMIEGEPVDFAKLDVTMTGISGTSNMKVGNIRDIVQDFKADELSYSFDMQPPEGTPDAPESMKLNGKLADLSFDGTGAYPLGGFDPEDFAAMLKAGFAFNGTFAYKGGETTVAIVDDGSNINGSSSSESGTLNVAMSEGGLSYSGEASGMASSLTGPLPFPIEINADKSAFGLTMPISKSDDAQDFGLKILLGNFTTSEGLWAMIDPGAQLPRDPATLSVDLSGKAKLGFDMMDPESMASVESGEVMPGEVESLNVNAIELTVAGASLTGDGAFTFDNTDMTTFAGMPRPEGAVDLKLVGGNGLLDKLVAMGLLPEDQAMGARMMMGLFAVPGDTPDSLNSKIEINAEGHVSANGQRLR